MQTPEITLAQLEGPASVALARTLFREYEEAIGIDLAFQGFDAELSALPAPTCRRAVRCSSRM